MLLEKCHPKYSKNKLKNLKERWIGRDQISSLLEMLVSAQNMKSELCFKKLLKIVMLLEIEPKISPNVNYIKIS